MRIGQLEQRVKHLERKLCCKTQFVDTLPEEGNEDVLYILPDGSIYIWDVTTESYVTADLPTIVEITYNELVTKILNSELVPGQKYLITDFATTHYFLDGDNTLTDDINVAPIEQLVITASSVNALETVTYSTSYPQDILHYDWDPQNWINDKSFSTVQIDGYNNGTIIPGFKGVIYYREDTKQKNITHYDFRGVKFRRWSIAVDVWNSSNTYNKNNVVLYGEKLYMSIVPINLNNLPTNKDFWIEIFNVSTSLHWSYSSYDVNNIPVDALDFIDLHTFPYNYSTIYYNNYLGPKTSNYNEVELFTILPNIVFNTQGDLYPGVGYQIFDNNIAGGHYYGNLTIGSNFHSNVIGFDFYNNIIDEGFYKNNIRGDFKYNVINFGFTYNVIDINFTDNVVSRVFTRNTIDGNFRYNLIADSFTDNIIGYYFSQNTINRTFYSNKIGRIAENNTIGRNFGNNTIGGNFNNNTTSNFCSSNVLGDLFENNTLGISFNSNNIKSGFNNNVVGDVFTNNIIDNDFNNNTIGNNFYFNVINYGFVYNIINNDFKYNNISINFGSNTIGNSFSYNTIGVDFQENTVGNNFQYNVTTAGPSSLNFTGSTHVYTSYTKTHFVNSNSQKVLSYINASNVLTIVSSTA